MNTQGRKHTGDGMTEAASLSIPTYWQIVITSCFLSTSLPGFFMSHVFETYRRFMIRTDRGCKLISFQFNCINFQTFDKAMVSKNEQKP